MMEEHNVQKNDFIVYDCDGIDNNVNAWEENVQMNFELHDNEATLKSWAIVKPKPGIVECTWKIPAFLEWEEKLYKVTEIMGGGELIMNPKEQRENELMEAIDDDDEFTMNGLDDDLDFNEINRNFRKLQRSKVKHKLACKLILPRTIKKIHSKAFAKSEWLKEVVLNDGIETIEDAAFAQCVNLEKVVIPGCRTMGKSVFCYCNSLKEVILGEGIKKLGKDMFDGCCDLIEVTLNEGLETIGEGAFSMCESLSKVSFPKSLRKIKRCAFIGCDLKEIALNDGLEEIEECAFHCDLKEVTIPGSVKKMGQETFEFIEAIHLNEGIEEIKSDWFKSYQCLSKVDIPQSVKIIRKESFLNNLALKSITIPIGVKKIETATFKNCPELVTIELNEGIEEIEDSAFENCISLKEIVIPNSVKKIGVNVFRGCVALEKIVTPSGEPYTEPLTTTGYSQEEMTITDEGELIACDMKEDNVVIVVPKGVKKIGTNVFNWYKGYAVVMNEGVEEIAERAFHQCWEAQKIVIPESVKKIGAYAFSECCGVDKIVVPHNVTVIEEGTFHNCDNLQEVVLEGDVTTIGDDAFSWCRSLRTVNIPSTATSISKSAFEDCPCLNGKEDEDMSKYHTISIVTRS